MLHTARTCINIYYDERYYRYNKCRNVHSRRFSSVRRRARCTLYVQCCLYIVKYILFILKYLDALHMYVHNDTIRRNIDICMRYI